MRRHGLQMQPVAWLAAFPCLAFFFFAGSVLRRVLSGRPFCCLVGLSHHAEFEVEMDIIHNKPRATPRRLGDAAQKKSAHTRRSAIQHGLRVQKSRAPEHGAQAPPSLVPVDVLLPGHPLRRRIHAPPRILSVSCSRGPVDVFPCCSKTEMDKPKSQLGSSRACYPWCAELRPTS